MLISSEFFKTWSYHSITISNNIHWNSKSTRLVLNILLFFEWKSYTNHNLKIRLFFFQSFLKWTSRKTNCSLFLWIWPCFFNVYTDDFWRHFTEDSTGKDPSMFKWSPGTAKFSCENDTWTVWADIEIERRNASQGWETFLLEIIFKGEN